MAERQNLNSKLLPSTFYGLIARLFLASTIITSGTIFISRNQDREPSNRIDTLLSNNHLSIYPNVSNIAVVERKTDRSYELQIIDSKGNKKLIFDTLQGDSLSQLSWSPYDKNKLVFVHNFYIAKNGGAQVDPPDRVTEICIIDTTNGYSVCVNSTQNYDINPNPKWGSGGKIIYNTVKGAFIMESDGTNQLPYQKSSLFPEKNFHQLIDIIDSFEKYY